MNRPDYTVLEHPADVGFELRAPTREALYSSAVLAYYDMLVGLGRINSVSSIAVEAQGTDDEDLMVGLLSECVYTTEVLQFVACDAQVESLSAPGQPLRVGLRLIGEPIDAARHPFELGVKAVTYHELCVRQEADGTWYARVIFDI